MKGHFAYIRVSTQKQGQKGVSLIEQRSAIEEYAKREGIVITEWFEERATAAKRGRPLFSKMLTGLRRHRAEGVVLHKIDRGSRNLKDWSDLGELIDAGVDVRFTTENLDLTSRGGRLSADLQAVVAADYIRNLREETRKGFYGRLKQGYYPLPAPIGYCNHGGGAHKTPHPEYATLIRKAFEKYSTGKVSIRTLSKELCDQGLRKPSGVCVGRTSLGRMLRNPFYAGVITIKKTGESFKGGHEPLITPSLFEKVQDRLDGKAQTRKVQHQFEFRRLIKCAFCERVLIGERQKGRVYYRCHNRSCSCSLREDWAEAQVAKQFSLIQPSKGDFRGLTSAINWLAGEKDEARKNALLGTKLRLEKLERRLDRLTDTYVDGDIDKDAFKRRNTRIHLQISQAKSDIEHIATKATDLLSDLKEALELSTTVFSSYISASTETKRNLIESVCSNLVFDGEKLELKLYLAFQFIKKVSDGPAGCPFRDTVRTFLREEKIQPNP